MANRVSAQQARAIGTLPKRASTLFSPVFDTSRCIAICAAAATGSRASLTWRVDSDVPAALPIEASLAHDILINLLDNAYKASPNGRIDVSISIDGRGGNSNLVISVSDSGHSSPCELSRPQPTPITNSDMRPSRGLGLTIVRADLRSISGQLEFSFQPNGGSRSVVSIPIRDSAPASVSDRGVSLVRLFSSKPLSPERIKKLVEIGVFPLICRVSRMPSVNGTLVDLPLVAAYCDESPDTLVHLRSIARHSSGTPRPFVGIQERLSATREPSHFNYILDFSSDSVANQAHALSPFRRHKALNSTSGSVDRLSILLCEDSSIVAAALRSSLLQCGHRCDLATTETEALQSLRSSSYDLVITDRFLGEVDVCDSFLLRELAANQQLSILLTADASSTTSRALGSEDFFRVLIKPVTAKELLRYVSDAVKRNRTLESVGGEGSQTQSSNGHRATEPSDGHEPLDFLSNKNLATALKVEALVDLALCLNHLSFGQRKLAKLSLHRLIGALQYLGATSAEDSARSIGENLIDSDNTSPDEIEPFADMAEQIAGLFEKGWAEIHHDDLKLYS
ncbi:MAG: response regulator [Gammaproteobacteria bacterium]|nr:response regulator [Gammaproteobacteria bacterium]